MQKVEDKKLKNFLICQILWIRNLWKSYHQLKHLLDFLAPVKKQIQVLNKNNCEISILKYFQREKYEFLYELLCAYKCFVVTFYGHFPIRLILTNLPLYTIMCYIVSLSLSKYLMLSFFWSIKLLNHVHVYTEEAHFWYTIIN